MTTKTPLLYSNGILLNLKDHSEILFLLANAKSHIDVVIRGHSPMSHWHSIEQEIISKLDAVVDVLSPSDLFKNEYTFPLVLDHLGSLDDKKLATFNNEESKGIINGKPGEVKHPPPLAWSFRGFVKISTSNCGSTYLSQDRLTP